MKRRLWVVGGSAGIVLMLMIVSVNTAIASNANNQQFDEKNVIDQLIKKSYVYQKFFQNENSPNSKVDFSNIIFLFIFIFNTIIGWFIWFSMTFLR